MPPANQSKTIWVLLLFGAAFLGMGWGLRALVLAWVPAVDANSFGLGATLIGVVAAAVAFAAGRWWRPQRHQREELINQSVLSHAAHSIISTDERGRIETFSRGAETLLGFNAADVVGRVTLDTFHDRTELEARAAELAAELGHAVAPGFEALVGKARETAHPEERDWTYLRCDGTRVSVRLTVTPMRDRRRRVTGYLAVASDITEYRHAEERRREFDARLSKIASQVPGMVFQFRQRPDGSRCFPYASEGIREIYRLEPEDVTGDSSVIWKHVHPEDVHRLADSINLSAQTLQRWQCEYRTLFPDGTQRWHWGNALPERQPDGTILWHGFITDITERKRAEQAHEENRVLMHSVFTSVDLGMFVVDVVGGGEFRFVEVNPAYERLTGLKADEIRGRFPHELVPLIPIEMAECLRNSFRRGMESAGPIEYEEPFFVRGRLLWWVTRLTPLRDAAGKVVRLVGRSLDITERKTVELRFQSLTERLQLATEAAQVGIWDHDLAQNRIVWDKRMLALHGVKSFDSTYRAWRDRIHPEDVERVEQELREAAEGKKSFNTSYRIVWPDGEQREVRACAHVQRNPAGRAVRMVGVNWDVTAERLAQAQIELARDQAEDLNRQLEDALDRAHRFAQEAAAATVAKSEFLANMSHEIRTPLNAVIGMCELLLGTELQREQREFAETIRSSGDGLLALINDILDYSKIESGRLDLERRPFALRDCVESSLDVLAARAAAKKIDLVCAIDTGVPEAIVGDDTRLRQVLVNLLSNAVKFTAQGEVFLAVSTIASTDSGVRLRFVVHDSGIGIPADRMDRLFKTFSQVDASTTRQYGGTGLGLAISKRIVELMGGNIGVESTVGRGSAFSFEIDATAAAAATKPFNSGRLPVLSGRRLLIVDDNATSGRALSQQAVAWGLVPRAVASPSEALVVLAQEPAFDLALLDSEMPEMTGAQLAEKIRAQRPASELPIALLTWPGQARTAPELGIAGFVNKPVKTAALFDLFVEMLSGQRKGGPAPLQNESNLAADHPLAILLAEDNPVNQRVAILMLQRLGYRADIVSNGAEALEAVLRQSYDLVFMDVQMPKMDGLQATREICARVPKDMQPRIVAMTANASNSDRDACLGAGMHDFLPKPVRAADLAKAIRETRPRFVASAA